MRKKLLGTIAAVAAAAAGAGGALAQMPAGPSPIGRTGAFDSGVMPANGYNPAVPAPIPAAGPMMDGPMPGGPGMDPMLGGGEPQYPPAGPYMQNPYEKARGGYGAGPSRFFVDAQYLLYFPKSMPIGFPLLTTSAPADTGVIGGATTTILAGERPPSLGVTSGFRLTGGFWRPEDQRIGFELSGLYISPSSSNSFVQSSAGGIPTLARPFVTAGTNIQTVQLVSFPGFTAGSASTRVTSETWGIDANGLLNLFRTCPGDAREWSLNLLGGFRYIELEESLRVSTRSQLLDGATAPYGGLTVGSPTFLEVRDRFDTLNKFYGGQVGVQSHLRSGRWFVGLSGKVAFGMTHQVVDVDGATAAMNLAAGTNSVTQGGLLANASNIGRYRDDVFGIVTDVNATVGFQVTSWLTATVGYNFLHMSSVARPGDQFNGIVDPVLVPTSASFGGLPAVNPNFTVKQNDFWMHGLNFGFVIGY